MILDCRRAAGEKVMAGYPLPGLGAFLRRLLERETVCHSPSAASSSASCVFERLRLPSLCAAASD